MASEQGKAAFAFVKKYLEKKPGAPFAEVSQAGEKKGHKIWPIVYGRAQLLLGQAGDSKPKKAKAGKKKSSSSQSVTGRRGPGRPRKVRPSTSADAVESLIGHIRELEQERDDLREKLAEVRELVGAR